MKLRARTLRAADEIGSHVIGVVAINNDAPAFYLNYGSHTLKDDRYHLYLTIATIRKLNLV